MSWFKKRPEPPPLALSRDDLATVLRYEWMARFHRLAGDESSAALCDQAAETTERYLTLKTKRNAAGRYTDERLEFEYRLARHNLNEERGFWRQIREVTQGGHYPVQVVELNIPTDDELLAGA